MVATTWETMEMHSNLHRDLARQRQRDLERAVRARRLAMLARHPYDEPVEDVVIPRAVGEEDDAPYTLKRTCMTSPS
jgi:hypothetical protein